MRRVLGGVILTLTMIGTLIAPSTAAHAAPDPTYGDDQLTTGPTRWWSFDSLTAAQITDLTDQRVARLTDISVEPYSGSGPLKFSGTMVPNSGAYRTSSWAWYYGQTMQGVHDRLKQWNARPVSISRYQTSSGWRFAVVMVDNSGDQARGWYWWSGSLDFIRGKITETGYRFTRLSSYQTSQGRRYDVLMAPKTGTSGWWWWAGGSTSQINDLARRNGARLIDASRNADGTYNAVMVKNTTGRTPGWYVGYSRAGLEAKARRKGGRLLTVQPYDTSNGRRYLGVLTREASDAALPSRIAKTSLDHIVSARDSGGVIELRDSALGTVRARSGEATSADARFRTASISKTFVATELLKQVAAGRVDLDAPLSTYLPGMFRGTGQVTVRMLLNHTSGIHNYTTDLPDFRSTMTRAWTPQELVAIANRLYEENGDRPVFTPGSKYGYSNSNYVAVALIIQKVTGKSYGAALKQDILDPLNLSATSVPSTTSMPSPTLPGRWANDGSVVNTTGQNPTRWFGAGQLISTTANENTFYRALLRGQVLPSSMLTEMKTGLVDTNPNVGTKYAGLGIFRTTLGCGAKIWWHSGRVPGYRSWSVHNESGTRSITWSYGENQGGSAIDDELIYNTFCYL